MKYIITERQYRLVESTTTEKLSALRKYWSNKKKTEPIYFDYDDLEYWGITEKLGQYKANELFRELVGNEKFATRVIKKLIGKTFSTNDFKNKVDIGGYDFKWVVDQYYYQDFQFYLECTVLKGGTVTLINNVNQPVLISKVIENEDIGLEIEGEVRSTIEDCMNTIILSTTGEDVSIEYVQII